MKHRIRFRDFTEMAYPELCPGCLSKDLTDILNVYTTSGVPGVLSIQQKKGWPICSNCAQLYTNKRRVEKYYLFLCALGMLSTILITIYLGVTKNIITFNQGLIAIPIFLLLPLFTKLMFKYHSKIFAERLGLSFGHEPIYLRKIGKQAFRDGHILEFDCYFSEYAKAFRELNSENGEIIIRPEPNETIPDFDY
ncbi:MAG: hypothetical protein ACYTFY_22760 [Planctomycetota bacterium]